MSIISNITPLDLSVGEQLVGPFANEILADRKEYWLDDISGMFYVNVPAASDQSETTIQIIDENSIVIESTILPYTFTTNRFDFLVDMAALEAGNYTITINIEDTVQIMADQIQATIASVLTNLGYTVYNKTLPRDMEWDNTPSVTIIPKKPDLWFMAFRGAGDHMAKRNVSQSYEVVYLRTTDLSTTIPADVDTFKNDIYNNFMGISSALLGVSGAWDSRVKGNEDFRNYFVPKGYNFTCLTITVQFIQN